MRLGKLPAGQLAKTLGPIGRGIQLPRVAGSDRLAPIAPSKPIRRG